MGSRQHFDVMIAGSSLGAAVAGALLARRGYRVLYVAAQAPPFQYEDGDDLLPAGPQLLPPVRTLRAAAAVLEELGLSTDVQRREQPIEGMQVLLPRHRLALPPAPAARARELQREFGADGAPVGAWMDRLLALAEATDALFQAPPPLPPTGFRERGQLKRALRETPAAADGDGALPGEHPVERALAGLQRFISSREPEPEPLGVARTLGALLRAPTRYPGGAAALADEIAQRVDDHGGQIVGGRAKPAPIEELSFDGWRFVGAKLEGLDNDYRAEALVLGMEGPALRRLLPRAKWGQRRFLKSLSAAHAQHHLLSFNLVMKDEGLPRALAEAAVLVHDPAAPLTGANLLLVERGPARKAGKGQEVPGRSVLTVSGLVPAVPEGPTDESMEGLRVRAVEALQEYLPFFESHIVRTSHPRLAAGVLHTVYGFPAPPALGVSGLSASTPFKNVVLAGSEVMAGGGVEGAFLAGRRAADLVSGMVKRTDVLAKEY